MDMVPLVHHH